MNTHDAFRNAIMCGKNNNNMRQDKQADVHTRTWHGGETHNGTHRRKASAFRRFSILFDFCPQKLYKHET